MQITLINNNYVFNTINFFNMTHIYVCISKRNEYVPYFVPKEN